MVLDVNHPDFYTRLERIVGNNKRLSDADTGPAPVAVKVLRKLPFWVANTWEMARLFFLKPIASEALQPAIR